MAKEKPEMLTEESTKSQKSPKKGDGITVLLIAVISVSFVLEAGLLSCIGINAYQVRQANIAAIKEYNAEIERQMANPPQVKYIGPTYGKSKPEKVDNQETSKITSDVADENLIAAPEPVQEPSQLAQTAEPPAQTTSTTPPTTQQTNSEASSGSSNGQSSGLQIAPSNTAQTSGNSSGNNSSAEDDTIVYVSNASNKIHKISNCSGMKNYREMTKREADANNYVYCKDCW